eukprot:GSChrysophyteH1.ASY1.ANO1.857.1 assembled CDS
MKGWERSAKKYAADKKDNNSEENFKKVHGTTGADRKPKTEKELRRERKSSKPNFELVETMKSSWNKVRTKSTPDDERKALLEKMSSQMQGHVPQVTLRHDASRMTQCLLQFGSTEQRQAILAELLEKSVEIAKTPYGHFAILKAISYCTSKDDQRRIAASLKGHFVTLGTNVVGARTVESICTLYHGKLSRPLRNEFYGPQFTLLLDSPPTSLDALLSTQPAKKEAILDHLRDLVQKFVDKGLLEFRYVHDLIWEYVQAVEGNLKRMEDLAQQLVDSTPKLISTKPGVRSICQIISYSGAKDRKRVLKSLKGKTLESLLHSSAHLAVMRIVDVTDDTVSVQKMLLDELRPTSAVEKYTPTGEVKSVPIPPLISVATHHQGRKLLLRLLRPTSKHLEPDEESLFEKSPTSKKDSVVRRNEHVAFLRTSMVSVFSKYASLLLRDSSGCRVLEQAMTALYPKPLFDAVSSSMANETVDELAMQVEDIEDSDSDSDSDSCESESSRSGSESKNNGNKGKYHQVTDNLGDSDAEDCYESKSGSEGEEEAAQSPAESVAAIEEDKIVHATFKRILTFEAAVEQDISACDTSLWEDTETKTGVLALALSRKLMANTDLLLRWLQCNRACFALVAMLSVPSAEGTLTHSKKYFYHLMPQLELKRSLKPSA